MHEHEFVRGKACLSSPSITYRGAGKSEIPLLLTTGRMLSQYNVGAQTRRTENIRWLEEDVLEIHEADAETRGIQSGDWVAIRSRMGEISLGKVSDAVAEGVVYTTFITP